jgi:hypothetical protein
MRAVFMGGKLLRFSCDVKHCRYNEENLNKALDTYIKNDVCSDYG